MIARFDMSGEDGNYVITPYEYGDYVLYEDYKKLEERLKRLLHSDNPNYHIVEEREE